MQLSYGAEECVPSCHVNLWTRVHARTEIQTSGRNGRHLCSPTNGLLRSLCFTSRSGSPAPFHRRCSKQLPRRTGQGGFQLSACNSGSASGLELLLCLTV